jgi:hypothetical protein
LAGTKVKLQDVEKKTRKRAEEYSLMARTVAPDVHKRAVSSMNSVYIDHEIDPKLFKFGKKSASTKEIEFCIKSHNYVKNIQQRPQTSVTSEIANKYIQRKQTDVRPYTASALLTDKQQVRITTPNMRPGQIGLTGGGADAEYFNQMEELEIIQDNDEEEDIEDFDNSEMEAMYLNERRNNPTQIRMAQTHDAKFGKYTQGNFHSANQGGRNIMSATIQPKGRPLTSAMPMSRTLSALSAKRPISGQARLDTKKYFTLYNKEVTHLGDDIPFEELFDRNERTLCATFAKFGDLSYHTPHQRIGQYMQFSARLTIHHLKEIVSLQNTITNVEKNVYEIPIQLSIIDEMNPFQKKIKTGISSVFKKEELEREPITVSIYPEYFEDSEEEEEFDEDTDTGGRAAQKYFSRQLDEMGGIYDPEKLGINSFAIIDPRYYTNDISKRVKLSNKRFENYINSDEFIKNQDIAKYKRDWMSRALAKVPEKLLKQYEESVRRLFHEIFGDYCMAIKNGILEYVLRSPEERKRLYIDLLVREVPTSAERIFREGGYSILLYPDWHSYVDNSRKFLQNNLYCMNIVNSSLLDWFQDFRKINLVEKDIIEFMGVLGYSMNIQTFIKLQTNYRNRVYAFLKNIWLRGAYLILKKFKFFRVFPEKRGEWTQMGFTMRPYSTIDFYEKTMDINIEQIDEPQAEEQAELIFGLLVNHIGTHIAEQLDMPLSTWADVDFKDLIDIRDSSAYRFHAMYNGETICFDDNGYKLLNPEVRKNLRKSVGILLGLQLRQKVEESLKAMEDMFLSIKRIGDLEKEMTGNKSNESKIESQAQMDQSGVGTSFDGRERIPTQETVGSKKNESSLGGP